MPTNQQVANALLRIAPEAKWTLSGDNYDEIIWHCECIKPSKSAVDAEIAKEPDIAAAKATARQAVLDRLGITAEEAQLILGGSN
jgi:hypothetical protein